MTTTPDFRELCDQLANKLAMHCGDNEYAWDLIERTHAALATPPPEPPTDEELEKVADHYMVMDGATGSMSLEHLHFARAVLERWGNQATITQTHND